MARRIAWIWSSTIKKVKTMADYPISERPSRKPTHPGALLRDELDHAGLAVTEASRRLGVSRQMLHRILAGRGSVTAEMALRIGKLLGNGPNLWLRMQQAHDLAEAEERIRGDLGTIKRIEAA